MVVPGKDKDTPIMRLHFGDSVLDLGSPAKHKGLLNRIWDAEKPNYADAKVLSFGAPFCGTNGWLCPQVLYHRRERRMNKGVHQKILEHSYIYPSASYPVLRTGDSKDTPSQHLKFILEAGGKEHFLVVAIRFITVFWNLPLSKSRGGHNKENGYQALFRYLAFWAAHFEKTFL
jgi:hypothetical protein